VDGGEGEEMTTEEKPLTLWEVFAAPRRTGTHPEHRYVCFSTGKYYTLTTFCRDCGYKRPDFWNVNILATPQEPTQCEPDKYKPSWVIQNGYGYITREETKPTDAD
jgi:hypothetical protein